MTNKTNALTTELNTKKKALLMLQEAYEEAKTRNDKATQTGDAEIMSMTNNKLVKAEQEVKAAEKEIAAIEKKISDWSSKDWANHTQVEVRLAWHETETIAKKLKFNEKKITKTLTDALQSGDEIAVALPGPTGSGKSSAVKWVGGNINKPVFVQNFTGNMEEIDLIGGPAPDGKGGIVMKEAALVIAMRVGGIFVAEEFNFAKPQVLSLLNSLFDSNRCITLTDGTVVKAHEDFRFVATLNPKYKGTKELNIALNNRFSTIIYMDRPTNEQLKQIINLQCDGYGTVDKKEAVEVERLIALYNGVETIINTTRAEAAISPRQLISMVKHLRNGEVWNKAFEYGALHQVGAYDHILEPKLLALADKLRAVDESKLKAMNKIVKDSAEVKEEKKEEAK